MADEQMLAVRFEMRATQKWIEAVDRWRAQQPGIPSRAEAIRRLVETALDEAPRGTRGRLPGTRDEEEHADRTGGLEGNDHEGAQR